MITLKNVVLRRGAKVILDSASVSLNPGEKIGLVGRNGAGKSSLFAMLNGTLHEDGDPLDILVRINEPTFPGCQIDCRPLGVLKMLDRGEPDDKIIAVPCHDPYYHEYFDIADLSQHYLKEVEHFFHIYKDLEGRRVEIVGWEKSEVAAQVINESIARYQERFYQVGT